MNKEKLVSIILPIYNVEKFLSSSIESAINQTYKNLEIILVDDGSKDNSGKICDEYSKKDKRIKIIHKVNGGLSDARNAGLDIAKGEYIYLLDSDDYIETTTIEKCINRLEQDQSDLVIFNFRYCDEEGNTIESTSKEIDIKSIWSIDDFWNYIDHPENKEVSIASVVAWNKLYKKEIFDNLRYIKGRINEDSLIITDIIVKVNKISYISEKLYSYRMRSGSIMASRGVKGITDSPIGVVKRCEYLYEHNYIEHFVGNFRTLMVDSSEIKKHYKELSDSQKEDYNYILNKIKEFHKILKKTKINKKDRISVFIAYRFPCLFKKMRDSKHR